MTAGVSLAFYQDDIKPTARYFQAVGFAIRFIGSILNGEADRACKIPGIVL